MESVGEGEKYKYDVTVPPTTILPRERPNNPLACVVWRTEIISTLVEPVELKL